MKVILIVFLSAVLFHTGFCQNSDIATLTKINQDWANFSVKKDTANFSEILADDFVLIAPNGAKRTKREVVSGIIQQDIRSIQIDSVDVKLPTNDTGIITCYTSFVLMMDRKEVSGKNSYQDVYVKRKGRWYAIAAHVTLLHMN